MRYVEYFCDVPSRMTWFILNQFFDLFIINDCNPIPVCCAWNVTDNIFKNACVTIHLPRRSSWGSMKTFNYHVFICFTSVVFMKDYAKSVFLEEFILYWQTTRSDTASTEQIEGSCVTKFFFPTYLKLTFSFAQKETLETSKFDSSKLVYFFSPIRALEKSLNIFRYLQTIKLKDQILAKSFFSRFELMIKKIGKI